MTGLLLRVMTLTGVYLLVLTSLHPADVLTGLVLSVVVVAAAERVRPSGWPHARPPGTSPAGRLAGVPALVGGTLVDIARGSWEVTGYCLGRRTPAPGMVAVPIGRHAASSAATWGIRVGLAPDSVVVEVDEERGEMLVHVLDARDPDAVRAAQQGSYERYQRRVFP